MSRELQFIAVELSFSITTSKIIHENIISFIQDFPLELGIDKYIDYDLQFEKSFVEPLKAILDAIGWNVEKTVNLELFFG